MRETFWSKIREFFEIRRRCKEITRKHRMVTLALAEEVDNRERLCEKLAAAQAAIIEATGMRLHDRNALDAYVAHVTLELRTQLAAAQGKLQECRDAAYRMDWDWFKAEFEGKAKIEKASGDWTVHPNGKHSHSIVYIDPEFKDVTELVAAHNAERNELATAKRELATYRSFAKGGISDEMCEIASGAYEAGKADQKLDDDIRDSLDGLQRGHQKPSGSAEPEEHEGGPKDEGPGLQTLDPGAEGRSV